MSAYRSNLNSINNNVLKFARHNDAHSDDALEILLTNIYTANPAAVIVQSGVNWRTTDFQAWAIYYNPEQIFNPAAPNKLEIIDQFTTENNFAYTGTFTIYDETGFVFSSPAGNYFTIETIDYQAPGVFPVNDYANPFEALSTVLSTIAGTNAINPQILQYAISFEWEISGVTYRALFDAVVGSGNLFSIYTQLTPAGTQNVTVILPQGGVITGDPLPALGATGRWGLLLNQYNTTI